PAKEFVLEALGFGVRLDRSDAASHGFGHRVQDPLAGRGVGILRVAGVVGRMVRVPPDAGLDADLAQRTQAVERLSLVVRWALVHFDEIWPTREDHARFTRASVPVDRRLPGYFDLSGHRHANRVY